MKHLARTVPSLLDNLPFSGLWRCVAFRILWYRQTSHPQFAAGVIGFAYAYAASLTNEDTSDRRSRWQADHPSTQSPTVFAIQKQKHLDEYEVRAHVIRRA
jgi:hypothetical protein